jgi:hypothetical protein
MRILHVKDSDNLVLSEYRVVELSENPPVG